MDQPGIDARIRHFFEELAPRKIIADVPDRQDVEGGSRRTGAQEPGNIMDDDVELAVVPDVQELARSAFLPAQGVISFEREENSCPDSADTKQLLVGGTLVDA